MSDDRMVFDGTNAGVVDLAAWTNGRVPHVFRDDAENIEYIAVLVNPEWPVIEKVFPGDTIIKGPDDVLTFEHVKAPYQ